MLLQMRDSVLSGQLPDQQRVVSRTSDEAPPPQQQQPRAAVAPAPATGSVNLSGVNICVVVIIRRCILISLLISTDLRQAYLTTLCYSTTETHTPSTINETQKHKSHDGQVQQLNGYPFKEHSPIFTAASPPTPRPQTDTGRALDDLYERSCPSAPCAAACA